MKQFDVQDHLYSYEKQDHSTRNGETANVNTEELEHKVAGVEKSYQQGRWNQSSVDGIDGSVELFQVDDERRRTQDVDNGKQDDERTGNLLPT